MPKTRSMTKDASTQTKVKNTKALSKAYLSGPYTRKARLYRPEVKLNDIIGAVTSTTTTAGRVTISDIDEGTDYAQRLGDWITAIGLDFKVNIAHNPAQTTTPASFVRLLVVQDLEQANNVLSSLSEVIQGDYLSAYNYKTTGRFKVYMDKLINLDSTSKKSTIVQKTFNLDFGIQYDGDIGTNMTKNGFYFFFIGSDSSNGPLMDWNLRFKYIDS